MPVATTEEELQKSNPDPDEIEPSTGHRVAQTYRIDLTKESKAIITKIVNVTSNTTTVTAGQEAFVSPLSYWR